MTIDEVLKQVTRKTTGIGSLPHHNVDTALDFTFKFGIPFLPQIPIRNPWEFMIPQALEGLPGLQVDREGIATLNLTVWESQSHILAQKLEKAFRSNQKDAFEAFEPSSATSSCWQPFLWEIQEREIPVAKIQIAGPLTAHWALKIKEGSRPDQHPELVNQIYRLVLARALAMVNRMISSSIQPILFLDEPGLYGLTLNQPKSVMSLQELKLMIQTLKKAGAIVGLHCCSNTAWESVLNLGMDILSIDTSLSLSAALSTQGGTSLKAYVQNGGSLALGVIPTTRTSALQTLQAELLAQDLREQFLSAWGNTTDLADRILEKSFFSPACGLAFQSTSDVELILEKLDEVYESFDHH